VRVQRMKYLRRETATEPPFSCSQWAE
jgi:hypothetical protein